MLTLYLSTTIWKPIKGCSQTTSGRTCQKWNESSPHKPNDQMVNHVIKVTGSSNHNKCAKADVKDPKAWCYTVDSKKRWEHCSPLCAGSAPLPSPIHEKTGTRFRDIEEQVPTIDRRSKYDQKGNCLKDCKSMSIMAGIEQCGPNECQKPKPHWVRILNWFTEQTNDDCSGAKCYNIFGQAFFRLNIITIVDHWLNYIFWNALKVVFRQKNIRPLGKLIWLALLDVVVRLFLLM